MARHVSEIAQTNERILIVDNKAPHLSGLLIRRLEQYDVAIQRTDALPPSYTRFQRIFFLNMRPDSELQIPSIIKTTVILFKPFGKTISVPPPNKHLKYIILSSEDITDDELTQLLWFSVSSNSEHVLDLRTTRSKQKEQSRKRLQTSNISFRQKLTRSLVLVFTIILFGFIVPLVPATILHLSMLDSHTKNNYAPVSFLRPISNLLSQISTTMFVPARPFYSLFSVSLFPESFIRLNNYSESYFEVSRKLAQAEQLLLQSLTTSRSSSVESPTKIIDQIGKLNRQTHDYLDRITANLPSYSNFDSLRKSLKNKSLISDKISKALPLASAIANGPSNQNVMILVVNNTRVRGSGGIIDSIGFMKLQDRRITSSRFYSAKQLQPKQQDLESIAPILVTYTPAEATMLNDATTSVDLYDAQNKILASMAEILNGQRPTTTILVTTTALQNILEAFPDIQLNDGREIVTSENIAIKQQMYGSDPVFFPAIMDRLSDTLGTIDPSALFSAIITSFNEKQLALLSSQSGIQKMLDGLYWSGKTISPKCISTTTRCINDYLFSVDQDLSSRTGPAYIQKSESKSVRFLDPTTLESTVRISWKNESPLPANQGGTYRIYTQLLLPPTSKVLQITKNNVLVEEMDTLSGQYNIIGLYLEVAPRHATELAISYTMPAKLGTKTNYQLITQKQLGSFTGNFSFDLMIPVNYEIGSTNIDAVVNRERISYNDVLNTDKLFFVELKRKK